MRKFFQLNIFAPFFVCVVAGNAMAAMPTYDACVVAVDMVVFAMEAYEGYGSYSSWYSQVEDYCADVQNSYGSSLCTKMLDHTGGYDGGTGSDNGTIFDALADNYSQWQNSGNYRGLARGVVELVSADICENPCNSCAETHSTVSISGGTRIITTYGDDECFTCVLEPTAECVCDAGYKSNGSSNWCACYKTCENCGYGMFCNADNECEACPPNTYMDDEGAEYSKCFACEAPGGYPGYGADSVWDCYIPANTLLHGEFGTYEYISDCHYRE